MRHILALILSLLLAGCSYQPLNLTKANDGTFQLTGSALFDSNPRAPAQKIADRWCPRPATITQFSMTGEQWFANYRC